ncbi:dihydrofolate reductase type 3 [Candidatus Phycosocius bacilliformis]|uniref:Dihydrofolate reductase n=1 Tax=Candidatus Phycosocius bacilliformis TaxID=1445552 RepID=A0A2P2EB29_9PROT|nr:dihydrofolate reductase [Candidatus Phycosocius bacilliformis]GBF58265.1 dihydrofolate reductase type 3 [Candidatus Phycosocius bacilliformis]
MSEIRLSIVVARAANHVIGQDQDLPWRLASDLKHFKAVTMGKPVIMGRKTWQSIGRALPGRPNLVVTRDTGFSAPGASVWTGLETAIAAAKAMAQLDGQPEVCVIGGGEIYAATLKSADRLYLTDVDACPKGSTLFPELDEGQWREVSRTPFIAGPKDDHDFVVRVLDRRTPADTRP